MTDKKPPRSVTVPIAGTDIASANTYRLAIKLLAATRRCDMGDLVLEAMQTVYGQELEPLLAYFVAQGDTELHHPADLRIGKP